ncbi:MAG: hypothetical protein CO098_09645 [Bacteroidetes bacterium CG_4_9_14_3_um_filter_41_19]|nr:MAG: hypothetical protein CO098_09645 [Bacteroidetes bacterium CG_4_9_14_3_um_filter_41_19]
MNRDKVCIITVNYGTPEDTIECLQSIRNNSYESFYVTVVDVLNINKSVEKITRWVNEINDARFFIIEVRVNRGFAYANNIGVKKAIQQHNCDFLWLLNNDTVINHNTLKDLIACYRLKSQIQDVGFMGSKIMDYVHKDIIQSVGGTFNPFTGYSKLVGMGEKDTGQFDGVDLTMNYVVGASMLFHVSLIQQIGLMPENYFLYYEDIDWCIKAQKKGFINTACLKSVVYHKQGISTGAKLLSDDIHIQNKKYLYISYLKFYHIHYQWLLPVAYLILLKQMAGKIFHNNFAEAKLIFKIIFNFDIKDNYYGNPH